MDEVENFQSGPFLGDKLRLIVPIRFNIKFKGSKIGVTNFLCKGEYMINWNVYKFNDEADEHYKKLAELTYDALSNERIVIEYDCLEGTITK